MATSDAQAYDYYMRGRKYFYAMTLRAIELPGEAIDNGFGYRAWLENDNTLEGLREDPRFQALVERLD